MADRTLDRDDAVATGAVLDHHRMAPLLRELLREQPPADIGAGAGPERHDEYHGAGRPALRLCGRDERRASSAMAAGNYLIGDIGISSDVGNWRER